MPTTTPRPPTARDDPPCPGPCGGRRRSGQYLSAGCWHQLTIVTRASLNRKDVLATQRLQELLQQLRDGVPLDAIRVTR